jgi:hypothetical protein
MQVKDNFVELLDDDPPPGVAVHTLLRRPGWPPDTGNDHRTIKVTRTDGSTWPCRAIIPGFEAPITDIISPMPVIRPAIKLHCWR